ncbi:MAG: cobaltochelatase subunit CobN [Syntrophobacteraceae bacterium]|nr:cobaltochelatase subunit CobN [Syntrophobacteraceae bacterium]
MKTLNLCYFSATSSELPSLSKGVTLFNEKGGRAKVTARTQTQLFDQARVSAFVSEALRSDVVILTLHGGKASCPAFDPLVEAVAKRRASGEPTPYLHIQPVGGDEEALLAAREHADGIQDGRWSALHRYLVQGGPVNVRGALAYLDAFLHGKERPVPDPIPVVQEGIYHPDVWVVPDIDTYSKELIDPRRPTVGLWFFQSHWMNGNLAHIDALIREIEARGANALAVFSMRLKDISLGNLASDEIVHHYFMKEGKSRIDVLINVMSMSMTLINQDFRRLFVELNVPVLQAMTSTQPYAAWQESLQGVSVMDVCYQAAQPEFDGNLITFPVATREEDSLDPITGGLPARFVPIPDRVPALVSLALKWAKLRRVPNSKKRIAVVFHHYPPRNDRIGCAVGLDTFASVKHLLDRMAEEGYHIEQTYGDGDELAEALLDRMTCDRRWLTPDRMAERSEASARRDSFLPWHNALPPAVRTKMTQDWGPMPGDLFVHRDTLHFPGFVNGNIFLTIQPPRGTLEKTDALYHDLHLSPPHHYLAHYRWIRDVFGADAVLHVGKHGSLEWLPGKALGLSRECYPDLAIQDLPNLYPYIINDPSEGTQAKRRSYCCLIDHLTPAYTSAGLYEDLAAVEHALADYTEAARQDPGKLPVLADLLWDAVEAADLDQDLGFTKERAMENRDAFLDALHRYLSELADTMIGDGLHTLGQAPQDRRLIEFLAQLTRLPNGDVPSLREELLKAMGYCYESLAAARGALITGTGGKTGGQLIAQAHEKALALLDALAEADFDVLRIPSLVEEYCGTSSPSVERVLRFTAETLVPNIRQVSREIEAILRALSGGFVEPGPSGAPTRGQAEILPTGRNFYSLDPRIIPSQGAWEVGKALGDALLERYRQSEGRYPDSVGIILWGGPTMRSKGDDVAEILYLLGIRPRWEANGVVSGLEVIPQIELGRPRIDVVPRISGFFRDAFPNLVQLIDEAIRTVAFLRETPETNFVRRHVLVDLEEYGTRGMREEEARRLATLRVFGCPPGTYGAGVAELVESRQWQSRDDLGEIYIRYSAHAYGQGSDGTARPGVFRRLLSRMDVTVKNEDSREYDMLSCTDFYNYYGGLISAVNTVRGAMPMALVGDGSDPRRVVLRTTGEEAKYVLRARLLNPKWLEGLKRHGYKGAGDISKVMDILLGWDATAEVMEDWMYERVADKYALDSQMQEWLKEVNPYALQNILDKLIETIERGMWNASDLMKERLRQAYLDVEGEIEEAVEGVKS